MTKACSKCKEIKDVTVFYKMKALRPNDDGYDYYCKQCRNASSYKTWNTNKAKCTAEGCDSPHYAKSLCKCHYHKKLRRDKKESK